MSFETFRLVSNGVFLKMISMVIFSVLSLTGKGLLAPIGQTLLEQHAKRVFTTHNSHLSWRRLRGMVLGGIAAQVLTFLTIQTACLWLAWGRRNDEKKKRLFYPGCIEFLGIIFYFD